MYREGEKGKKIEEGRRGEMGEGNGILIWGGYD